MKTFSDLFHDLDCLTKTNQKLDRLVSYFENAPLGYLEMLNKRMNDNNNRKDNVNHTIMQ